MQSRPSVLIWVPPQLPMLTRTRTSYVDALSLFHFMPLVQGTTRPTWRCTPSPPRSRSCTTSRSSSAPSTTSSTSTTTGMLACSDKLEWHEEKYVAAVKNIRFGKSVTVCGYFCTGKCSPCTTSWRRCSSRSTCPRRATTSGTK